MLIFVIKLFNNIFYRQFFYIKEPRRLDNINKIIGNNLNRYRRNMGLSLDKVSEMTGVSKGMIGQIERGETNPSVSTLWKISSGLHISSTSLFEEKPEELVIIKKGDLQHITDMNARYTIYPTFKYDPRRDFEVLIVDLEPGCIHRSEPHGSGVDEYIYVCCGSFELSIDGRIYLLSEGDSIKFHADKAHEYRNSSSSPCSLHSIIYYNR